MRTKTSSLSVIGVGIATVASFLTSAPAGSAANGSVSGWTYEVSGEFATGTAPAGIAVTADGAKLNVANRSSNSVLVRNLQDSTDETAPTLLANFPTDIVTSPDGAYFYVTSEGSNKLLKISQFSPSSQVPVASFDINSVDITSDGRFLYTAGGRFLRLYSTSTFSQTGFCSIYGGANDVAIAPDGRTAFVTDHSGDLLFFSPVDTQNPQTLCAGSTSVAVGSSPTAVAIAPNGKRVYVVNNGSNSVSVIDADPASGTYRSTLATVSVGASPQQIAMSPDGQRAYVTNAQGVSVINTSSNAVDATITGTGFTDLYGVTVSPDSHKVYVTAINANKAFIIEVAGVPDAPGAPTAIAGDAQASLSWSAESPGATPIQGYLVEQNDGSGWNTAIADTQSAVTSATVRGLTNGTSYRFRVSAINSVGTGQSSPESLPVTPTATPAPSPDPTPTPTPSARQHPVKPLNIPKSLNANGWTTLVRLPVVMNSGEIARVRARLVSGSTLRPGGDVAEPRIVRTRHSLRVYVPGGDSARVRIVVSAPVTEGYAAYRKAKVVSTD